MYLYKQKLKDGDTYLAIKEKYYVPNKGTRERTIEKIGRLSELVKKWMTLFPITHSMQKISLKNPREDPRPEDRVQH